jgi:hypothetical protein
VFGCLFRLGCLLLIAVGGVLFWLTRDRWQAKVTGSRNATASTVAWQVPGDSALARGRAAVQRLAQRSGPAYANLTAAELVALLLASEDGRALAGHVDSILGAVQGDRIAVRALVSLEALGGSEALGPLGRVLPKQDWVELEGSLAVPREGVGEFRVERIQLGELPLPRALVPRVLQRLGVARAGSSGDVIAIPLPRYVADVRVGRGRITLYKNVP